MNESKIDRLIRAVLAVILVIYGISLLTSGVIILGIIIIAIGGVLGVTAYTGSCPLYKILGINTCKFDK